MHARTRQISSCGVPWSPGCEKPFNKQEEGGTSCLYAVSSLVLKRLATLAELAGSLKCPGMGMLQKILQAGVSMHLDGGGNVPSRSEGKRGRLRVVSGFKEPGKQGPGLLRGLCSPVSSESWVCGFVNSASQFRLELCTLWKSVYVTKGSCISKTAASHAMCLRNGCSRAMILARYRIKQRISKRLQCASLRRSCLLLQISCGSNLSTMLFSRSARLTSS